MSTSSSDTAVSEWQDKINPFSESSTFAYVMHRGSRSCSYVELYMKASFHESVPNQGSFPFIQPHNRDPEDAYQSRLWRSTRASTLPESYVIDFDDLPPDEGRQQVVTDSGTRAKIVKTKQDFFEMMQQPVVSFGGQVAAALVIYYMVAVSTKPSRFESCVKAFSAVGSVSVIISIAMRRFKRELSEALLKLGIMTTLAAIISLLSAPLQTPLACIVGTAVCILVGTSLAFA